MAVILLVEDQADFQDIVRQVVSPHEVLLARNAQEALSQAEARAPDLILLDVMLPDGDGFHLFPKLRSLPKLARTPIIFLTGKTDVSDRIAGFALGAEDYILKPFEPLELRARIESKLARIREEGQFRASTISGDLRLDLEKMRAFGPDSRDLALSLCEFRLLAYFSTHEGHVLTRDQLMTAVWSDDVHVLERTIDRHISTLKKKISPSRALIETVRGMGYRFVAGEATE